MRARCTRQRSAFHRGCDCWPRLLAPVWFLRALRCHSVKLPLTVAPAFCLPACAREAGSLN